MTPPNLWGGQTSGEINWPWIIRVLRNEPYRMTKAEMMKLKLHEIETLVLDESIIKRDFSDPKCGYSAEEFADACRQRENAYLLRLLRGF